MIAFIGGSGLNTFDVIRELAPFELDTPYGTINLQTGYLDNVPVVFLLRHGKNHTLPPHLVNYRGNIWALRHIGAHTVFAVSSVGSLRCNIRPGDFVIVDQFMDFTSGRPSTFFDKPGAVTHIDMTDPYCPEARALLIKGCHELGIKVHETGCYVCTNGPRYETAAEVKAYAQLGGDVVGMTNVPEVVLAAEAGLCYSLVCVVTNYATGIARDQLSHSAVVEQMQLQAEKLRALLRYAATHIPAERNCLCKTRPGNAWGLL